MIELQSVYEELKEDEYSIRKLKDQRKERYASIFPGAIDYSREKVQTSASNPMEGWVADIDALDRKIAVAERALEEKRQRYVEEYGLQDEPVIRAHYIDLIPWSKVGSALGISRMTVHRKRKMYEKARKREKK